MNRTVTVHSGRKLLVFDSGEGEVPAYRIRDRVADGLARFQGSGDPA